MYEFDFPIDELDLRYIIESYIIRQQDKKKPLNVFVRICLALNGPKWFGTEKTSCQTPINKKTKARSSFQWYISVSRKSNEAERLGENIKRHRRREKK